MHLRVLVWLIVDWRFYLVKKVRISIILLLYYFSNLTIIYINRCIMKYYNLFTWVCSRIRGYGVEFDAQSHCGVYTYILRVLICIIFKNWFIKRYYSPEFYVWYWCDSNTNIKLICYLWLGMWLLSNALKIPSSVARVHNIIVNSPTGYNLN